MRTILENQGGNVKLMPGTSDEMSVRIPPNQTALGLLSRNHVNDNEVFSEDYWVYKDGKRIRKWFSYCEGWNHFWTPVLDDIKHLESVYHKLQIRSQKRYGMMNKHLELIMRTSKQTKNKWGGKSWFIHAKPSRPENQSEGECWLYDIHISDYFGGPAYSMNWVPLPSKFSNLKLGNQLSNLEQLSKPILLHRVGNALDMAFIKYLRRKFPTLNDFNNGNLFEIRVDGRHYIYQWSERDFSKHAWPGDKYQIVDL